MKKSIKILSVIILCTTISLFMGCNNNSGSNKISNIISGSRYDKDGFDKEGFNKEGFNREGFDKSGYNKDGFDKNGYNKDGYNKEGFDKQGYNKEGYNKEGFNKQGYNKEGYKKRELGKDGKPLLEKWGLGKNQTESVSNDRDYDWYINQRTSGEYASINCVPTCCTMAIKWVKKDFNKSVETARSDFLVRYNEKRGWPQSLAVRYIKENGVKCHYESRQLSEEKLKKFIKDGNIVIVDTDLKYLTTNNNKEQRTGRNVGVGQAFHEILVKGYKVVDGKLYFETYDPDCFNEKYKDNTPVGKDRYYLAKELMDGIKGRMSEFIVIDGSTYDIKTSTSEDKEVNLSAGLDKAIRNELGKIPGKLHESDLKKVFRIDVYNGSFPNLDEFKDLTNLEILSLFDCHVENINGLSNLKNLEVLQMPSNKISDLTSLKELKNLKVLSLRKNNISDLASIKDLSNLTELYLENNMVNDLTPLESLKNLETLLLDNNKINDITPLKDLTSLKSLRLKGNNIKDFSPVKSFSNNLPDKDF